MAWLYDIQSTAPEIWGIQILGAFLYEGQLWPAGSWYLIHYGQGGRRKVISDAQFQELDRVYGEAVILTTHPPGMASPMGPRYEEHQRRHRTGPNRKSYSRLLRDTPARGR